MHATDRETTEVVGRESRPLLWLCIGSPILLAVFFAFFVHYSSSAPLSRPSRVLAILPALGVVAFESGKPTLTADGQATLDRAADVMRGNPNVRLRLEGYDAPQPRPNRIGHRDRADRPHDPLTIQRSRSVEAYLDAKGIDPTSLTGGTFPASATIQPATFPEPDVDSRRAELYVR